MRRENLVWEGVVGSLSSTTTPANFEHETDKAVVTRCPISFELSMSRALHFWYNKGFYHSKHKYKPIAVSEANDDSRVWTESRT